MVIGAAVDAGHANGTCDEIERYKSCGGYVLMLADKSILENKVSAMAVLDWRSGMTQRVCRSTLAAEASHLAEAVEAVDWAAVFMQEVLQPSIDLRAWQQVVRTTARFWATDAKSVYDYLTREGSSMSKDKRMDIEGALLKDTLKDEKAMLRWIDGSQNIADVLTKLGVDKTYLYKVLRECRWSLVQDPAAAEAKRQKAEKRSQRKKAIDKQKETRKRQARKERAQLMAKLSPPV